MKPRPPPSEHVETTGSVTLCSKQTVDAEDVLLIAERLAWSPKQRLDYLRDMVAFEERARRARRLD